MSLSLHLKSILATTLTNADGSHSHPTSHHKREEGWTEVFGNYSLQNSTFEDEAEKGGCDYDWRLDDLYVFR